MKRLSVFLSVICISLALIAARPIPSKSNAEFWAMRAEGQKVNIVACRVAGKGVLEAEKCQELIKPGTIVRVSKPDFTWQQFEISGLSHISDETPDQGTMYFNGEYKGEAQPAGSIRIMGASNDTYRDIACDWLHIKGFAASDLKIQRLIRTDLQGDGTDEVLINFENSEWNFFPPMGSEVYSVVLLRYIRGGEVVQEAVAHDMRQKLAEDPFQNLIVRYEMRNLADVDGDGVLDLLMQSSYYEGHSFYFLPVLGPNKGKALGGWFEGV